MGRPNTGGKFLCKICHHVFTFKKNLYAHERSVHSLIGKLDPVLKKDEAQKVIQCPVCNERFSSNYGLKKHISKSHPDYYCLPKRSRLICPNDECTKLFSTYNQLVRHLCREHKVKVTYEDFKFESELDFNQWKQTMEKETMSRYTQDSSSKPTPGGLRRYYFCHRSYMFKSKGQNKRALKTIGTNKIGRACPSRIQATYHTYDEVRPAIYVRFWSTHCGHGLEQFRIPKDKKIISFTEEYEKIRAKLREEKQKRKLLRKRKYMELPEIKDSETTQIKDSESTRKDCIEIASVFGTLGLKVSSDPSCDVLYEQTVPSDNYKPDITNEVRNSPEVEDRTEDHIRPEGEKGPKFDNDNLPADSNNTEYEDGLEELVQLKKTLEDQEGRLEKTPDEREVRLVNTSEVLKSEQTPEDVLKALTEISPFFEKHFKSGVYSDMLKKLTGAVKRKIISTNRSEQTDNKKILLTLPFPMAVEPKVSPGTRNDSSPNLPALRKISPISGTPKKQANITDDSNKKILLTLPFPTGLQSTPGTSPCLHDKVSTTTSSSSSPIPGTHQINIPSKLTTDDSNNKILLAFPFPTTLQLNPKMSPGLGANSSPTLTVSSGLSPVIPGSQIIRPPSSLPSSTSGPKGVPLQCLILRPLNVQPSKGKPGPVTISQLQSQERPQVKLLNNLT